jgi:hypothetical protein
MARAWAVVQDGEPLPNTVSETRRGALVNWLWTVGGVRVADYWFDAEIEEAWAERSAALNAQVSQVAIKTVATGG